MDGDFIDIEFVGIPLGLNGSKPNNVLPII